MSQLNVDSITNRTGTSGPTIAGSLTVNGDIISSGSFNLGQNLNISGILTCSQVIADSFVSPGGGLNISGVTTSTKFESTVATGTSPLVVNSTTLVSNLNADLLDGQQGSYYTNAGNLDSGIVPTARLATGTANVDAFLRGDSTWQPITSYSDYGSLEQVSGSTRKSISAIYSHNPRGNGAIYTWSSNGPWTTLYTYGAGGQIDAEQLSWLGLGFFQPAKTTNGTWGERSRIGWNRQQISVDGNCIGYQGMYDTYARTVSYPPISVMMMPIRNNHPTESKTITLYGVYSNYWSGSGVDGYSLWQYTPGQPTYNITSGTWTLLANQTSGSSYGYTSSASITIPPQTTHVVMQCVSMYYWTSSGNYYVFYDWNRFYNLSATFSDPYIQVDSRMINTMRFADWQRYGLTTTEYQFYKVYNACSDMYGNR